MKSEREGDGRTYVMKKRAAEMERTGKRILSAAFREFSRAPFVDVTISGIAEAAGCSEQTVYRRYGSKEGLFMAVADRVGDHVTGGRDRVPAGDVRGAVSRVVRDYEETGDEMILLQRQEDRVDVIRQVVERGRDQHHRWISRVFEGELADLDPESRRRAHGQLVVALDVQTWKRLRRDMGLGRREAARSMEEMAKAILASISSETPKPEDG